MPILQQENSASRYMCCTVICCFIYRYENHKHFLRRANYDQYSFCPVYFATDWSEENYHIFRMLLHFLRCCECFFKYVSKYFKKALKVLKKCSSNLC